MENKDRHLPNPEQLNYGHEMKAIGYEKGYAKCTYDARRRKALKERQCFERFGTFMDHLSDRLWENRRR